MKKSIVMFVFAMATLSFVSCKDEAKEETTVEASKEASNEEMHTASYVCPMDCEKGKTYDEPGKCPVCEMDLIENAENHEGHNH